MLDYIVIGMGMIGSAALKYLSGASQNVVGIGPAEPPSFRAHKGVFASHYDQARVTRVLDTDLVWATLAKRSIARYRHIEERSGIKFYSEVGCLRAGDSLQTQDLATSQRVGQDLDVRYELLDSANLKNKFPFLQFLDGSYGLFEDSNAGFINPRALIAAQLQIAGQSGAQIVRQTVVGVATGASHVTVQTDDGKEYQARKVLVTAGAFSNCNQLLENNLAYKSLGRTILLAKVSSEMVERLASMPSVLFRSREGISIYVLPPVLYPDGSFYVKIGSGIVDAQMQSLQEFQQFFHTDGSVQTGKQLQEVLESLLPALNPIAYATSTCVVAITESDRPYIDTVVPSQVFVAAGGCGAAAKSSDEIGRLGAMLVERETWQDSLEWSYFKKRYLTPAQPTSSCAHSEPC